MDSYLKAIWTEKSLFLKYNIKQNGLFGLQKLALPKPHLKFEQRVSEEFGNDFIESIEHHYKGK